MSGRGLARPARIVAIVLGALATGCTAMSCAGSTETTVTADPPPPLEVEFSGCAELWAGTVCELPQDGKLRLWVKVAPEVELSVKVGTETLIAARSEVQGGAQLRVSVPAQARALTVISKGKGSGGSFPLMLTAARPIAALARADVLRAQGRFEEAKAEVATVLREDADLRVRARATGKSARLALALGDIPKAVQLFGEALEMDRSAGLISGEANDRTALAHVLLFNGHRFTDVNRALAPLAELAATFPDGRARMPYYQGLLAMETGDLRTALRMFRGSEKRAERLGLETLKLDAVTEQLEVLHTIGLDDERLRATLTAAARSPETSVCKRAELLTNLGSFAIPPEKPEAEAYPASEASGLLEESAKLYRTSCPKPLKAVNALADLALAELREGRPDAAGRHVGDARRASASLDARIEARLLEIDAHLALGRGAPDLALRTFDRLAQVADAAQLAAARLQAAVGRARALEALDQPSAARAAYDASEQLLDAWMRLVPVGRDREVFVASNNDQVSRHRVTFLMRHGTAAEAADAARRSRSRSLASLEAAAHMETLSPARRTLWYETLEAYRTQRDGLDQEAKDDWKLPADQMGPAVAARMRRRAELREEFDKALTASLETTEQGERSARWSSTERALSQPGPGELFLVYHPIRRGWAGFAITDGGTVQEELPLLDPDAPAEALAAEMLSKFGAAIDVASRIRLLAYGALDGRDLHALPWRGQPLLAVAPIEYGVDLPRRAAEPPRASQPGALVVSDPSGTLPNAHVEGMMVASWLRQERGSGVEHLDSRDATLLSMQRALMHPSVDHFHYAGHGHFGEGEDESALSLADNGSFSVSDALALSRSPRFVVLSGCETAGARDPLAAQGLGLAQAFIISGARAAVAATRVVNDDRTGRLMATFYQALEAGNPDDAAAALRLAELEDLRLAGATAGADCSSFRALVP